MNTLPHRKIVFTGPLKAWLAASLVLAVGATGLFFTEGLSVGQAFSCMSEVGKFWAAASLISLPLLCTASLRRS